MAGYSISIFLPDGAPTGLRIARRSHWTGEVLMCPRTLYPSVSGRSEFARTGAYILVGQSEDGSDASRVYVGEGDSVRSRLKSHYDTKDFWNDVVVITKTDGSLHKADVRYLESRLVDIAKKSPTVSVENGTTPAPPEPIESHKADLDSFLSDTLAILRLLGITAFAAESKQTKQLPPSDTPPEKGVEAPSTGDYFLKTNKAFGQLSVTQDGFLLHASDGVAREEKPSLGSSVRAIRAKLTANGALASIEGDPSHLRLNADVSFNSPSAAAMFLCGASVNGRIYWKDSSGKSLAEREAEAVAESSD